MTYTRRISSKGGITIPQRLRHEAGLMPGMVVDLTLTLSGPHSISRGITINQHMDTCPRCGSTEDVLVARGITACRKCLREMLETLDEMEGDNG